MPLTDIPTTNLSKVHDMTLTNKRLSILLATLLCLLTACTHTEITADEDSKTIAFNITNYMQYDLGEGTRATSVASATALTHLALGIFDSDTKKMVGTLQKQNKEDEGYGSFTATLPYGKYTLVFLGYGGSQDCVMNNPEQISFKEGGVPQTFLCTRELTVNASTQAQSSIVLRRVVAGFRVQLDDQIPANATKFHLQTDGGGCQLNALTGKASAKTGRDYDISIPEDYKNKDERSVNMYLFLNESSEEMSIQVSAADQQGHTIASHNFTSVPMQVNTLTVYKGQFFAGQAYGFGLTVEEDWGKEVHETF